MGLICTLSKISAVFALFVPCLAIASSQNLRLVVTDSQLPTPVHSHAAVYDDVEGAIYVIGGIINNTHYQHRVIKYSLESGAVEEVGNFLSVGNGAAVMIGSDIIYFGGYDVGTAYSSAIYSYSTITNSKIIINRLPVPAAYLAAVWAPSTGQALTFGGMNLDQGVLDQVFSYNATSHDVDEVTAARLPGLRYRASAVWDTRRDVAYVLGGIGEENLRVVEVGETASYTPALLPFEVLYPCAVYADSTDDVYLIGAVTPIRFSPSSMQTESVHVEGWPAELNRAACVYVPRLDRIYVLGGQGSFYGEASQIRAEISYVDLDPSATEPTTTTSTTTPRPPPDDCSDGQIRVIPDPFCCESFYFCFGGEGTKNICPDGRHFDPDTLQCEEPDLVGCRISYVRRSRAN